MATSVGMRMPKFALARSRRSRATRRAGSSVTPGIFVHRAVKVANTDMRHRSGALPCFLVACELRAVACRRKEATDPRDLADAPHLEQRGQAHIAVARVVVHDGEVTRVPARSAPR